MIIIILIVIAGLANAISEASNQNALSWCKDKWWDGYNTNSKNFPLWMNYGPGVMFRDAFHFFKLVWITTICWLVVYLETGILFELSLDWLLYKLIFTFVLFSTSFELGRFIIKLIKNTHYKK